MFHAPPRTPVASLLLGLALLLNGPRVTAGPGVEDFTFALIGAQRQYPRLSHTQLIYAGYREVVPGQPELWYSHDLAEGIGSERLQPGELDGERGRSDSADFLLARPPSSLAPPYHVMAIATTSSGDLLIGSNWQVTWGSSTFAQLFSGIDLGTLLTQVRSDDLQGGEFRSLLLWMIRHDATLALPAPIPEVASVESPSGGYLWAFTPLGQPIDLTFSVPGWSQRFQAGWVMTGYDYVTPETPGGGVVALGFALGIGGLLWRRKKPEA